MSNIEQIAKCVDAIKSNATKLQDLLEPYQPFIDRLYGSDKKYKEMSLSERLQVANFILQLADDAQLRYPRI